MASCTNAVVANWVVFVPPGAVGAVGVPWNDGPFRLALLAGSKLPVCHRDLPSHEIPPVETNSCPMTLPTPPGRRYAAPPGPAVAPTQLTVLDKKLVAAA